MVSSVFGKAERKSHLGDLVSCSFNARYPSLQDFIGCRFVFISRSGEPYLWRFRDRSVVSVSESAARTSLSARDRDPTIHHKGHLLGLDGTAAAQPAYLLAAVEPVSHRVSRHNGLSCIFFPSRPCSISFENDPVIITCGVSYICSADSTCLMYWQNHSLISV